MYFKRYFSGTLPNLTDKVNRPLYTGTSGTTSTSVYKNQTDALGSAIAQALKECGLDAEWDSEHCVVWLDQSTKQKGFEIAFKSYSNRWTFNSLHSGTTSGFKTLTVASGYALFGSVNYSFYITIKGEPQRSFVVAVGSDSNPSSEYNSIDIIHCIDKRSGDGVLAATCDSGTYGGGGFAITKGTKQVSWNGENNPLSVTINNGSNSVDPQIVCLYPLAFNYCFVVTVDGVYGALNNLNVDNFYSIDGTEFYYSYNKIIKCTTPPPT